MQMQTVQDILTFLRRSKDLEKVQRYGASLRGTQNSVAEHSWRLALMALIIGTECRVEVDMNRTLALALIHDLAEAKTGDIDAYTQITGGEKVLEAKAIKEEDAMRNLTDDLSFGGFVFELWKEFEEQKTVEAKFVRALDRIEGFLHIAEGEVELYIPKEFHANYANQAVAAFDEATTDFPGLKDLLEAVKTDLKKQFAKTGVTWIEK